jgi:hypothetical protein
LCSFPACAYSLAIMKDLHRLVGIDGIARHYRRTDETVKRWYQDGLKERTWPHQVDTINRGPVWWLDEIDAWVRDHKPKWGGKRSKLSA